MEHICPMRANKIDETCQKSKCAWWINYSKECVFTTFVDIIADSDICKTFWNEGDHLE